MALTYDRFIQHLDIACAQYWVDRFEGYSDGELIVMYEVIVQTGNLSTSFFFDSEGKLTNVGVQNERY